MSVAAPRTIGVVTVSRSDYGHLRPVLAAIQAAPDLRLEIYVGGMHLSPRFGRTVDAVAADGWPIAARVDMLEAADTPQAIGESIGRGIGGFARVYAEQRPDILVVLGDRFEMLAATAAALPFALPVAHLHGGEASEGAIDNQIRHAITKLSHLHLVSADVHARRVEAMGEERWRIHTVGAPGLDRIRTTRLVPRDELARRLDLPVAGRWVLVTYHPVTLEYRETAAQADALIAALEKTDASLIVTYPNADTAGQAIIERLEEFAGRCARVRLVRNLGDDQYLSMLAAADAMVGNSSSGLIEAPSFALPVVNVGRRQQGRLRGANVIDVGDTTDEILAGLDGALAPGARERLRGERNPYGDGHAAERIVRVLREVTLGSGLIVKREVA
jgi:UDP-hydrolysing UDP-N-acetyl-D-glucosamine 2-epimerase